MKTFWRLLGGHQREFTLLVSASALLSGAEALLHPLLVKALLDEATTGRHFPTFLGLAGAYLALGLTLNTLFYFAALWRKSFENRALLGLESTLLQRALHTDWRTFAREGAPAYLSRIHKDALEGFTPSINLTIQLAQNALAALAFLGILIYLSWQASLILLLVMPALLSVSRKIGRQVKETAGQEREAEAAYLHVLMRTLEAFRSLRGLPHLLPLAPQTNERALRQYLDTSMRNYRVMTQQRTWSDLFMNLSDTLSMMVGGYFVFQGQLSFGGFLAFTNALWRAVNSIFAVMKLIPDLQRNAAILERIASLHDTPPAQYVHPSTHVRLNDVRVSFGDKQALHVPHFEGVSGEQVLVRGANGSGKSTLLHVLAGYLQPDTGEVHRPARVAALTAPVHLPPVTVGTLIPDADLRALLNLGDAVDQLPESLSSGQRQKLGIGTLLMADADLYVLDEPFANLDEESKRHVHQLILERTAGKGLVIVHHGDDLMDRDFHRVFRPDQAALLNVT